MPRHPIASQPDDVVRDFLAWPAAASFVTLISAACLLGGAWGVLAPTIGDPDLVAPRLQVVAVLVAYIASLLAVVWTMSRWQPGNPDALGASVVGAALTIGVGLTLDLIAVDRPGATAALGLGGLLAALQAWRRWNIVSGGATPRGLRWPLLLAVGWSFVWPSLMGWRATTASQAERAGGEGIHAMLVWLPGWWLVIAAAALALAALAASPRGADPWSEPSRPLLSRPATRWIQLLVILAAAGAHEYVLGFTANLDFAVSDFAALAALLALIGNELRASAAGGDPARDAAASAAPAALIVALVACGGVAVPSAAMANRGPDVAMTVLRLTQSPEATLTLLALVAAALWWRLRRPGLLIGALIAACAAVLVCGAAHDGMDWSAAAGAAAFAGGGWAMRMRHPRLALLAALALELAVACSPDLMERLRDGSLSPLAVLAALGGLTVLVVGTAAPAVVTRAAMRVAAWAWLVGVLHCCMRESSALHAPAIAGSCLVLVHLAAAWARRDPGLVAPLALPAVLALPRLVPDNKAWLGVWAAFALLASALAIGWRRIRQAQVVGGNSPTLEP